jgi:hypothetical protein
LEAKNASTITMRIGKAALLKKRLMKAGKTSGWRPLGYRVKYAFPNGFRMIAL